MADKNVRPTIYAAHEIARARPVILVGYAGNHNWEMFDWGFVVGRNWRRRGRAGGGSDGVTGGSRVVDYGGA